jgi:hypothetical protein
MTADGRSDFLLLSPLTSTRDLAATAAITPFT